jgi:hypothetical protein
MTRALPLLLTLLAAPDAGLPAPTVDGPGGKRLTLDAAALTRLGRVEESWTSRGTTRKVSGVSLQKILAEVGVEPGEMGPNLTPPQKVRGLRQAVVVTARDAFQAVFSVGELIPELGPTRVLVVDRVDGKALDAAEGPLRLVVLTDQSPSRSARQIRRIQVVNLADDR